MASGVFMIEMKNCIDEKMKSLQQAVTHPSTNPARQALTSVIGREPVFFF